jgi:hypothetical protein
MKGRRGKELLPHFIGSYVIVVHLLIRNEVHGVFASTVHQL